MSVLVDHSKCNGCENLDAPRCVENCPGDLMAIEADKNKSYIRDAQDCWDCMVCVKMCPKSAITTKLPYQLALYKSTLQPKVYKDKIEWTLESLAGDKEQFMVKTKDF